MSKLALTTDSSKCGVRMRLVGGVIRCLLVVLAVVLTSVDYSRAQVSQGYQLPPKEIADLIDAEWSPSVSISPDNKMMLIMRRPGLPSIAEVSQPELRLGGVRFNPRNQAPSRSWHYHSLALRSIEDTTEHEVMGLPENPLINNVTWSPDGRYVVFTLDFDDHVALWLVDVRKYSASRLSDIELNTAYGDAVSWMSNSKEIIALSTVKEFGEPPADPRVPTGPSVQENLGKKAPARTYQDMLNNEHDAELFEYYMTSQIVKVNLDGEVARLGEPGIVLDVTPSPDARYLLVETVHRPFSYTVPHYRFPRKVEVWDNNGHLVTLLADLPLFDEIPIAYGSVQTGPRSHGWRADTDATLYWVEAQDGGDASVEAEVRDQVFLLKAPFDKEPEALVSLGLRYAGIRWADDNLALVTASWWSTRMEQAWFVKPGEPGSEPRLWYERSYEDSYGDPGTPLQVRSKYGTYVLQRGDGGETLFLTGNGASPEGDRPFLDAMNIETLETTRLFRSEEPYYESVAELLDAKKRLVLTRRESVDQPPNYFLRNLNKESTEQVTFFPHPTPEMARVSKELIKYDREDGLSLTATLYLPPDYEAERDGPLPMLMWAYPREFKSADAAGQVRSSPYRFVRVWWSQPLLWLMHGYAVLDGPTMPIVGEGDEEPNDTYVEQLVASAAAAVEEVVRRGVADRDRIAIGGHSYGAFMAANLLAHSDLFRAGIARSGAYNRTLTPFGFQSEERSFWEAPDVYFTMSPFTHADKIDEPILLIHGQQDNNSGTYPIQSERFYEALKGLGGTARLVMLPHESHGYQARESVMHTLWEMTEWLDTYVKSAAPRESFAPAATD